MKGKLAFKEQVKEISDTLNLPSTLVTDVLREYIHLLAHQVREGMEVRVGTILRIIPDNQKIPQIATTGYDAKVISHNLGVPEITVLSILTDYQELIVYTLRKRIAFDVAGVVNLKPKYNKKDGTLGVLTTTSRTLIDSLDDDQRVRVQFNINLRHKLRDEVIV